MRRALLFLLIPACALLAEDFWKAKEASEWSAKDLEKMLKKSPWAKEAPVSGMEGASRGSRGRGAGMGADASAGGVSSGSDSDSMEGGGSGGGGRGRRSGSRMELPTIPEAPKVVVRWETAAPVLEAATRAGVAMIRPEAAQQFYIVSITGFPLTGGPNQDKERLQGMRDELMKATVLKRKEKDPVAPVRVDVVPGARGATIVFLFMRTVNISADEKEVVFATRMGKAAITSKFQLKDMTYRGALAL